MDLNSLRNSRLRCRIFFYDFNFNGRFDGSLTKITNNRFVEGFEKKKYSINYNKKNSWRHNYRCSVISVMFERF